jgi:DNA-binding MarR family transcriptional regulator/N-acetylglutamate synthase-like GNAT family acetyltransferase
MAPDNLQNSIERVRRFNRFYTRYLGVLHEGILDSPFSLTEGRVLYELAHLDRPTAAAIGANLDLDAGYLSRILTSLHKRKMIEKKPSETDARQTLLGLTRHGREVFAPLEVRSAEQVQSTLKSLSLTDQSRLIGAMEAIEELLGGAPEVSRPQAPYLLRPPHTGDMGWVVHRQGVLYGEEYEYDETFEALCAEIVAKFVQHYDAKRERCWIAERDGQIAGSVFLVSASKTVAKLRLLYVEPWARGLGIGGRLVSECVRFGRQVGYKKMILWTQSELDAARHIYKKAGFHVTHKKRHHSFSKDLVAETWEMEL